MEQIIITRKDGTTYPLAVKKEATDIKEARQSWGLLGDDVVNITVESPYPQHYEIGDYFSVFGRTYKLNQLPRVRKNGAHKYTYELTFEGVQYDLLRVFYDVTIETTGNTLQDVQGDALTGDLKRFASVLISNANRVFPGKWKLGACPDTIADKTLTFGDGDNCLAVYQNLCSTFEVEADITQQDGVYTINFYKRVGTTHPFVFEFGKGKGLYALDRQNVDSSNIVTRLKVFGSDDNITNKYRANRLCLPGKSKAQSFIEQPEVVQKYGIHEARKIFEDIKPTFKGRVSEIVVGNVLQFKDANMFDLNEMEADRKTTKYLVNGVSAKIHFNTGNLAGYEFEINASKGGYNHKTKTFTLIPIKEAGGYEFPDAKHKAFQISVGDEYKILDVTLPEQYQTEAEQKLQEQGNEYYRQNSQPKVKYGLSVAKSYLKKLFGEDAQVTLFSPGDYINIKDESIGVDKAVRIQSLVRNLLDVYDYTLTLSDVAENNITTRVISELIDLDKITTTHNLKDPARARANWRTSREVMNMVFDPDGDYYTDKIKPNSIDTLALSVGAKSMQFALQNVVFEPNHQGQKNVVRVSAGTLTHYTIEEQPRTWTIAQVIVNLTEDGSAYYIFARCNKVDNAATIVFSKNPIKVEEYANVYHFWIGVVNSVDVTLHARSIALSYGFSTINGRFIKTGRVESADGATYFDLDNGEIGGKIKFLSDDNGYITILDGGKIKTELIDANKLTARRVVAGDENGKHVRIDADNGAGSVRIFDNNLNECTVFEGEYYTGINELYSSDTGGNCTIKNRELESLGYGRGVPLSIGRLFVNTDLMVDLSDVFYSDSPVEVIISHGNVYTSATSRVYDDPSSAEFSLVVETYSDSSLTNKVSSIEMVKSHSYASARQSKFGGSIVDFMEDRKDLSMIRTVVPKGYHIVKMDILVDHSDKGAAQLEWGNDSPIAITWNTDFYVSRFFANGFCLGTRRNNYILATKTDSGMTFKMENNGYGFSFGADGIKYKDKDSQWRNL